jgi:hypothetical protein
MLRKAKVAAILTSASLVLSSTAFAAGLALTGIGALSTGGAVYSEWWYTGENPTLAGTAGESASVTVTVEENSQTVTADGSGNWSAPTATPTGDYSVSISSGGETLSFTLHTGQSLPDDLGSGAETTEGTGTVPETGSSQLFGVVILSITTALGYSYYTNRRRLAIAEYEKKASR